MARDPHRYLRPAVAAARRVAARQWQRDNKARFDAMDAAGAFIDSPRPDPSYWRS